MMKCLERLVKEHITSKLPPMYLFAYHPDRSIGDAISSAPRMNLWKERMHMLFLYFSSAFNTIISQHLISKLAPPLSTTNHIVMFADDMIVVGLIQEDNNLDYSEEVNHLVGWCVTNHLVLNVEINVDFRGSQPNHTPLLIKHKAVERVSKTKFL
ncbi:hypothetical protein NFI96_026003, partial [Prochilodus magdalenae]